ncbi:MULTISPECIES: response regulator transcription factor [Mesotoga]|jgi:DNA-binding response OmpR family regulator|uniref:Response regulator with CheY-like receiver domain and winged-helix DNA-binding domain n=1 Tax=Mesotoga prima MesG1.Ag.4.2 TaxID=660470 RepID=I2F2F4_9BACT|nr:MULTISPECIES: response regulator transcription factor [Mesotoga]MCP5456379.1 response regulator transcription factor [Thermotogota bacterium]CCU85644.1 Alkaline phosphatase synthesis transcriptional regulatory protein phoP [Mesotoga infera]AFK06107.1 response regulator with CheY-like receiver domain and winged-helix DNA-binding domain [Mesotoga prima MesG1.Ag.4.2]MCB1223132.1 response regulator transcription factor [Mesotoga sp.]MCP5460896.1 response regulator transcription factor [Thermoto
MAKKSILVVDDEPSIVELLTFNLKKEGYEVLKAYDAEEALKIAEDNETDMFIVDIMLPGMDGFELVRNLRATEKFRQTPVIFLSAKSEEFDKVLGLELGADDYITKPFSVREVLARIRAVFRRIQQSAQAKEERPKKILARDLEIDTEKYEVRVRNRMVNLTPLEFELLRFLAENEGKVFSRDVLLDKLWGYDYYGDTRTVDVHIRRLRTKIEEDASTPKYIITVRGKGYKFRDPGKED